MPDFNLEKNFSVPEGYFDTIAQRVMDRIPANEVRMMPAMEEKKSSSRGLLWVRLGTAAAVLAVVFSLGFYFTGDNQQQSSQMAEAPKAVYNNNVDNVDAIADYIMVDDQDLYAYLSAE